MALHAGKGTLAPLVHFRLKRTHPFTWIALALALASLVGLVTVKRLDEDNRFCVSCHLHEELARRTTSSPPGTLAAAHFRAKHAGHPERCFTCHSGEGVVGWSAVTALSAWDAARWVAGDRHEPLEMKLELDNRACLKCHDADLVKARSVGGTTRYHGNRDHWDAPIACVDCHSVHTQGLPGKQFLQDSVVRRACDRCHRSGFDS